MATPIRSMSYPRRRLQCSPEISARGDNNCSIWPLAPHLVFDTLGQLDDVVGLSEEGDGQSSIPSCTLKVFLKFHGELGEAPGVSHDLGLQFLVVLSPSLPLHRIHDSRVVGKAADVRHVRGA